jgi:nucleotide-binding universal stress UspA family protein
MHTTRRRLLDTLLAQRRLSPAGAPLIAAVAGFRGELAPETESALRWAGREASVRDVALYVVSIVEWRSVPSWSRYPDTLIVRELQRSADAAVETALTIVEREHPSVVAHGAVLRGDALAALRYLGTAAGVIALGSRRLPRIGELLLGSLSAALAACAPCPVVVVNDGTPNSGGVVVGISDANGAALRFAADFAQREGLDLHVVYAHAPVIADERVFRADAERWVAEALAGLLTDYPDLAIRSTVQLHRTVDTLIEQSHGQRLLVVGRRRGTRYPALRVGSVSQGVLHHAPCPVAVIPI